MNRTINKLIRRINDLRLLVQSLRKLTDECVQLIKGFRQLIWAAVLFLCVVVAGKTLLPLCYGGARNNLGQFDRNVAHYTLKKSDIVAAILQLALKTPMKEDAIPFFVDIDFPNQPLNPDAEPARKPALPSRPPERSQISDRRTEHPSNLHRSIHDPTPNP